MAVRSPDERVSLAVDTHAHMSMGDFDADRDEVIGRARALHVDFIEIGFDEESSRKSASLARKLGGRCAVGVHPHNAGDCLGDMEAAWRGVTTLLTPDNPEIVAVGEIGLDYARDFSPRHLQVACFEEGLRLAHAGGLPAVIHQREAEDQVVGMVKAAALTGPVIFHCFGGDAAYARRLLDLGGYLGLGGVLTYPKNGHIREAIKGAPLDRILLETDCPYLTPQFMRGKRNEPSYVLETARVVAELLQIGLPQLLDATTANAARAFLGKAAWLTI